MKTVYHQGNIKQKGAVSLFIVVFTALLMSIITIGFVQLMVRDQQQASYSDLSESAYDSATAGVEDAKRALLVQQDCLEKTTPFCDNVRSAVASGECNTLAAIFPGGSSGEVPIMQAEGDRRLEQAYTCVKITENTRDYIGSIEPSANMTLVPLRSEAEFDTIIISWDRSENGGPVNLPATDNDGLPAVGSGAGTPPWPENRPALLRAQLINGGGHGTFNLSDFDTSSYSNTLFLYPAVTGAPSSLSFDLDGRHGAFGNEPQGVTCDQNPSSGAYACKIELKTSSLIAGNNQTVFLGLAAFYNPTDYKVELRNSGNADPKARVDFDGVQPEVDSTGRANDLFRRVVSRVELNNTFTYPLAALETRNNICKNFTVTSESYRDVSECNPLAHD